MFRFVRGGKGGSRWAINRTTDVGVWLGLVALGALVLLWSPIVNGYPLIWHDTGTYLLSSFTLRVPDDRPIGYSIFVRLTRLYPTVWAVVVAQAVVTSWLILRSVELLLARVPRRRLIAGCVLAATAAVSSLSAFVGYAMPDIMTGWILLGAVLSLAGHSRVDRTAGMAALIAAMLVHNAHVYLALVVLGGVLAACYLAGRARAWRGRAWYLLGVALLTIPGIGLIHWSFGGGFTVSRGAPTQIVNRLVDTGLIDQTLALNCPGSGWTLCRYRDLLAQHRGDGAWFMWGEGSPIAELGWEQGGGEQTEISLATLRCCLRAFAQVELDSVRQVFINPATEPALAVFVDTNAPPTVMRRFYPRDLPAFSASVQQSGRPVRTMLVPLADVPQWVWLLSVAAIGIALLLFRRSQAAAIVFAMLAFVVVNAVVVGLLGLPEGRVQARAAWLLPFGTLVGLFAAFPRPGAV